MPPPVFMCCCSDLGPGHMVKVQFDFSSGMLLRPEACNQRLHVGWGNYQVGNKVLSFHCGAFDCPDHEQWDLFTDGTIHPRRHPHLALGMGVADGGTRTILVDQSDARKLVFNSVLDIARTGGRQA